MLYCARVDVAKMRMAAACQLNWLPWVIGPMMLRGENVGTLVHWILHDATIYGGNSGGPLVNTKGEVIGINEIGVVSLSGAIPANLAREVADQIIRNKRVIRGWSGITVQEKLESLNQSSGVVVADVAEGSPAAAAGAGVWACASWAKAARAPSA